MALILKNDSVFLHIPKTGGNWITKVLKELDLIKEFKWPKHGDVNSFFYPPPKGRKLLLAYTYKKMIQPKRPKPFIFCFVRNPLTWYESWFKYMEQPKRQWRSWGDERTFENWHPNSILNGTGSSTSSFSDFVRRVNTKRPGYVTELFGWYTTPQVNFIGKQEKLAEDLIKVLRMTNLEFDEEFIRNYRRVGVSPTPEKEVKWDSEILAETVKCEYAGLKRYGYDVPTDLPEPGSSTDAKSANQEGVGK